MGFKVFLKVFLWVLKLANTRTVCVKEVSDVIN